MDSENKKEIVSLLQECLELASDEKDHSWLQIKYQLFKKAQEIPVDYEFEKFEITGLSKDDGPVPIVFFKTPKKYCVYKKRKNGEWRPYRMYGRPDSKAIIDSMSFGDTLILRENNTRDFLRTARPIVEGEEDLE